MFRAISLLSIFVLLIFSTAGVSTGQQTVETNEPSTWPGAKSQWRGFDRYDFEVDGRQAYVVEPKNIAPGSPWVWRARFPDFHAEADLILLKRGFHVARINTDGMLGSPNAMQHWDKFYSFLIERGLAKRCALEGVSRGGLFVYGFASRWPERVACIYCDTPVCDIKSWPGGKGTGRGHEPTWKTCLQEYGLTEQEAADFKGNPIDQLAPIAKAKIPAMHIVSLNDEIVPPTENTFVLADRFRKLGGQIDIIKVESGTEESGGHHFTHPDPLRVADFIERRASALPAGSDYFVIRGSLDNCRIKFEKNKTGRVVFMGGSITTMKNGWREMAAQYLQERFPETKFEFIDAGISSTGSVPGSFRLLRDVFTKGDVDLFFEEAAVNDLHNSRQPEEMIRGMEGILRHARTINPALDIVVMHFVDPKHMADYRAKRRLKLSCNTNPLPSTMAFQPCSLPKKLPSESTLVSLTGKMIFVTATRLPTDTGFTPRRFEGCCRPPGRIRWTKIQRSSHILYRRRWTNSAMTVEIWFRWIQSNQKTDFK